MIVIFCLLGGPNLDCYTISVWSEERRIAELPASQLRQQPVAKLVQIPWWHNIVIVQKCENIEQAMFYVHKTIENNWSRSVLTYQIESGLFARQGRAITNFENTIPAPQSDLAREITKDPYNQDFLTLTDDYTEREMHKGLIDHVSIFFDGIRFRFCLSGQTGATSGWRAGFLA